MKRFRFSLEKALKLREYHEKETEIELGRAVGNLTRIEQAITATGEERDMIAAERFSAHNVSDLVVYDLYVQRLDIAKEQLLQESEQASEQVEEARGVYLEATRDRKVLDNLKERREQEYRKAMYAEETQDLDDIASGAKIRSGITG
jgi:flagellar FliJ protein